MFFTNAAGSFSMPVGKATRRPRRHQEEGGSNPYRTMMKAYGTFDIQRSAIRAAASCLALLPAELRLIGP